jgi:pSer/pThr/pTyr-binding forkhead associated (FHA) protein
VNPSDLDAQLRALGPEAPKTLARTPRPADDLRLRLRYIADLINEAGSIKSPAVLITRQAAGQLVVIPLKEKFTFGRNSICDLNVAADAELSRTHFRLISDHQNYFIEDLASRNGTYVNNYDAKITRRELRNGDLILAGAQVLLFWRQEPDPLESVGRAAQIRQFV